MTIVPTATYLLRGKKELGPFFLYILFKLIDASDITTYRKSK